MNQYVLDRPVWDALSSRQSQFAVGGNVARRFAEDIGPLAATRDDEAESLAEMSQLIPAEGTLILLQADAIVLPANAIVVSASLGVQMLLEHLAPISDAHGHIQALNADDVPAMCALAGLTKPGPFEKGTSKLGEYFGIKEQGVLLAMAGERMRHAGYTEISAVCTHPEARGRGFARQLTAAVARRILARGETPYLHTYAANTPAIRLYETLGFRLRRHMHVAVIGKRRA